MQLFQCFVFVFVYLCLVYKIYCSAAGFSCHISNLHFRPIQFQMEEILNKYKAPEAVFVFMCIMNGLAAASKICISDKQKKLGEVGARRAPRLIVHNIAAFVFVCIINGLAACSSCHCRCCLESPLPTKPLSLENISWRIFFGHNPTWRIISVPITVFTSHQTPF